MTVSGPGILISLTNYRGGEQGKMEGLKQSELYSEMSSTPMPRVAHQTVTTLLLTLASSACSDCYCCHPLFTVFLAKLQLPSLYYVGPGLSYPPPVLLIIFPFFPPNFTGLLSDLQLSASAFKLTILCDPGNRRLHKNSFLSVLDSFFSSRVLFLL